MDKSAKIFAGLALGSFCFALIWIIQGSDQPKPVIPTKTPARKSRPVLTPPPSLKGETQLAAFANEYLKYSPELQRVVADYKKSIAFSNLPGVSLETSDL